MLTRAKEDAKGWFAVNYPSAEGTEPSQQLWTKPPSGLRKCNVGVSWINPHVNCRVAWIVQNDKGKAILHCRRAFSNVESQRDAELLTFQWVVKDMVNTRQRMIIFESSCALARDTFLNSSSYEEHIPITNDIELGLSLLQDWSFHHCDQRKNSIAKDIAVSVTSERRYQSYIADGAPCWVSHRVELEEMA